MIRRTPLVVPTRSIDVMCVSNRVASHLFTGGFAGIGKLPALFGWYIRYWYLVLKGGVTTLQMLQKFTKPLS